MNKLLNSPLVSLIILLVIIITIFAVSYTSDRIPNLVPFSGTIEDLVTSEDTLHILTFPEYFPESVISDFENSNNIHIALEYFESPSQLKNLIENNTKYDIVIINDYLVKPISDSGYLKPIEHHKLSNFKLIDTRFRAIDYDYGNQHSIPFVWGTVGLSYNSNYVLGIPLTWKNLFEPTRIEYLSGKISLLDDYRITMGILLLKRGLDPNSIKSDDLAIITERLLQLVPYIVIDNLSTIEERLTNEELYMGMMWSGNAAMISTDNHNLRYTLPSEGTVFWVDNLAITSHSDNQTMAYKFIDYLLDPRVMSTITNSNYHANPITYSRRYIHRRILNGPAYANPYFSGDVKMIKFIGDYDSLYQKHWDIFMDSLASYHGHSVYSNGLQ